MACGGNCSSCIKIVGNGKYTSQSFSTGVGSRGLGCSFVVRLGLTITLSLLRFFCCIPQNWSALMAALRFY